LANADKNQVQDEKNLPPSLVANSPVKDADGDTVETQATVAQTDAGQDTGVDQSAESQDTLEAQREQAKQDAQQALETKRPVIREAREGFGGEYLGDFDPAPPSGHVEGR